MFIGHIAVAFVAKKAAPKTSLGTLVAGALFLDLLCSLLLLLGIEHAQVLPGATRLVPLDFFDYPYSHSLLMVLLWGALFAGGSWFFKKSGRSAVVLGLCVVSHWFLDLLVHRPDLPVMPSGELRLGIGLWNHPWISVPLEGLLFLAAAALYWREFRPSTRGRRLGLLALVMLLLGIWIGSLLGPPPPGIATVGAVGLAQWLFVAWAYRVDQRPGPLTG